MPAHAFRAIACLLGLLALSACTTSGVLRTAPYEPPTERYAAIVMNARTGKVLHETRPDAPRFPASLTKMMTLYLVFEDIRRGRISKSSQLKVSGRAAAQPASKLWLKAGSTISVHEAIQALAVKSANDVAYVVAENLSGSEAAFARRMTAKARALGMRSTTFTNASGLPDKRQISTARDMAKLSIALKRRYPQHFHYFRRSSMNWRGKTIRGHNRVLGKLRGANGIKTGYTRASGYNLATSVDRNGKSIVAIILGENSGRQRDAHMVQLVNAFVPGGRR